MLMDVNPYVSFAKGRRRFDTVAAPRGRSGQEATALDQASSTAGIWADRPRQPLGRLSAVVHGSGPALLLIHGVGLRAEAWGAQIDALAPRFQVIAVDMPGHGHSPLGDAPGLRACTDAIAAGLAGPSVVAGHSMGAMIALDLASRHPDLVRGVAALNAIYRRDPVAANAVRARARALDRADPDPRPTLQRWFGAGPSPCRAACQRWLTGVDRGAYAAAYRIFAAEDGPSDTALSALACPALFVTGGDEPNSTPAMSRRMAALAPRGRAVIVDGAAHMMPMTHPDPVNAALAAFAAGCQ